MAVRLGHTIKAILFQVHSAAGLVLALLVSLIALTGAIRDTSSARTRPATEWT